MSVCHLLNVWLLSAWRLQTSHEFCLPDINIRHAYQTDRSSYISISVSQLVLCAYWRFLPSRRWSLIS